jgi:carboxyl-terminal processing protease
MKPIPFWVLAAAAAAALSAAGAARAESGAGTPTPAADTVQQQQSPGEAVTPETAKIEDVYSDLETFANALTIIHSHYVEETTPKKVVTGALKGMLSSLDPYSQFLDPEAYSEIKVETEGKFGGIGVEITFRDGILTVISPVDGTPAAEAGVLAGDKVVKIDGKSTRDMTLEDSVKVLRGKPGTVVTLTVLREGEGRLLDISMKRAIIRVKSVKDGRILGDGIGYVRVSEFQENTPRDLRAALAALEKQELKGLILDLRNNPGGLLSVAVEVAEEFVPKGELIVYTKGRTEEQQTRFISKGRDEPRPYPVVVLINHGSASASEIVAGALRDHRLAIALGTQTFGKGSVQTVIPMRDGAAIRLTTAKYFTPSGNVIHGVGIKPDIEVPFRKIEAAPPTEEEKRKKRRSEFFEKVERISKEPEAPEEEEEEAEPAPAEKPKSEAETLEKELDNQILRAMDLIRGLNVFGVKPTHAAAAPSS